MLLFKVCFNFFLFSSILAFPQINFHLTDPIHPTFEHRCLFITPLNGSVNDTEEITSLCLSHSISNRSIQTNIQHQNFTFDDLRNKSITGEQLYQWSASIDLIEQYQCYLTSNQSSLANHIFYNCTPPRFGPQCEYEFIFISDDNLTLNEVILQFYQVLSDSTSLTCYIHLECDLGFKYLCLDWSDICDGYVDCVNDQIDEKFCWELLINECEEDEYRCRNGQCISKQFAFDNSKLPACLDQSDEFETISWNYDHHIYPPMLQVEDLTCFRQFPQNPSIIPMTSSCDFMRRDLLTDLKNVDIPDILTNFCSFAFYCTFYTKRSRSFICKDVCDHEKCTIIINETCPELIITTAAPVAFGHVYVGYLRQSNEYSPEHDPDYICYDEKLCKDFQPSNQLIMYNNKTCRRTNDTSVRFQYTIVSSSTIYKHPYSIQTQLQHCDTIFYDNLNTCNSSFLYRCQNSSKYISIYHLCDGINDCYYHDDENCTLFNGKCSLLDTNMLFKCPINQRCISWNQVGNNACDCPSSYISMSTSVCEDESYSLCDPENIHRCNSLSRNNYMTTVISFPTVCDGFPELLPIPINGTNHTDESECQYWKCNTSYTRCDGLWNCLDGADEIGCDEYPLINCSINHHICIKPKTFELMCLPLDKVNDGLIDCVGATDELQICRSKGYQQNFGDFYCDLINNTRCVQLSDVCKSNCINENADLFCNRSNLQNPWICLPREQLKSSYLVKYLCSRPIYKEKGQLKYFSLEQTVNKQPKPTEFQPPFIRQKTFTYDFRCHRGYPLRLHLDNNQTQNDIVCLCPASYYGHQCQYQNQRVSLTLQFQTYSDSRRTLFTVVIQLMDNSTQRMIHSSKQLIYVYIKYCQTKFNFYLTYSTRPKDSNKTYYVHIDIYEKSSFGYRGSLYIPLDFSFLPVHRISHVLNIPRDNQSLIVNCAKDQVCRQGQCMKYTENANNLTYCHCNEGWSGKDCSIPINNTCSSDSLFVGMEANDRSICLCPLDKWGPRCYLRNTICQSDRNSSCLNNGQCVLIDDQMVSQDRFFCICPKGFSGDRCEIEDTKIIVSFDQDIILSEVMLVHFIEVRDDAPVRNGLTFQSIPLYQRNITLRWSHPFHIVFTELSNKTYYLIHVQQEYNRSQMIEKLIRSSDRCGAMNEYLNKTIADYPLIRRIKYYHLVCQNPISCFYDGDDFFCLCNDFGIQRIANCFPFNSSFSNDCFKLSNCQNEGQCLQDHFRCPQTSRCICRECFYGSLCQFSSSLFDLSLDGIIGSHIQPNVLIRSQPPIIKITLALIVILGTIGFLNGILSFIAFQSKETRHVGCGYYLLGSTITTLLTSIMLVLKFSILLLSQMRMITNGTFLSFQCYSFDYLLQVCLNMDRWLNGCIAMERAFNIIKGANFNKNKSKIMAKYMIGILFLMTITSTIYDPLHRRLVDDDSNDEKKRVWCIVSYSSQLLHFNQFIHMFHFFVPFLLNIISSLVIIVLSTKRRLTMKSDLLFHQAVVEQIQQYRHLLIAPLVLVILSLPRLIISLVGGCMQSNRSPSIYLIGYLISFIPLMLTFVIFVLPSKLYKEEFRKTVKQYQETIRKRIFCFRR